MAIPQQGEKEVQPQGTHQVTSFPAAACPSIQREARPQILLKVKAEDLGGVARGRAIFLPRLKPSRASGFQPFSSGHVSGKGQLLRLQWDGIRGGTGRNPGTESGPVASKRSPSQTGQPTIRRNMNVHLAEDKPCNQPNPFLTIGRIMKSPLYPRFVEDRLTEALTDTPVVLVHGPRQCGKTTLAQMVGERKGYTYLSFDDDVTLAAASTDPVGFVADLPERTILDEVQRAPGIFTALKAAVDRKRTPGRFLLTGSANVLLVPKLADSLAGRMEIQRLHPLSQAEILRRKSGFLDALFSGGFETRTYPRLGKELAEIVAAGGYPPALARNTARRREAWYRGYVETLIQRDVRDLTRIRSLDTLPRLLSLAAQQTARLINVSDLAGPFQVTRPTIRDYVTLLTRIFLLEELPSWHHNRLKRLVKTPKLHLSDTGLGCALVGLDGQGLWQDRATFGHFLETFVYQELRRQGSWQEEPMRFHHYRDKDMVEVDIVLEGSVGRVAGVEVKAAATVTAADFRGLRKLKAASGERFAAGIVVYDGETSASFGDSLYAVPIRTLWEGV